MNPVKELVAAALASCEHCSLQTRAGTPNNASVAREAPLCRHDVHNPTRYDRGDALALPQHKSLITRNNAIVWQDSCTGTVHTRPVVVDQPFAHTARVRWETRVSVFVGALRIPSHRLSVPRCTQERVFDCGLGRHITNTPAVHKSKAVFARRAVALVYRRALLPLHRLHSAISLKKPSSHQTQIPRVQ